MWGLDFVLLYKTVLASFLKPVVAVSSWNVLQSSFCGQERWVTATQNKVLLGLGNESEITEAATLRFCVCLVVVMGFSVWWGNFKIAFFNAWKFPFKFKAVLHLNDLILFGNYICRCILMERGVILKLIHIHCTDFTNNFTNFFHTNNSMSKYESHHSL